MAAGLVKHSSATLDAAFEKSLTEENLSLADNEEINYDLARHSPSKSATKTGLRVLLPNSFPEKDLISAPLDAEDSWLVPSPGPATPASSGRLEISPPRGQLGSAKKQKMSSLSGEASKQDSAKSVASLPGSPVGAKPPTKGTKVPRVALLASKTAVPPGESKSAQKRNAKAAALATGGKMAGEKDRPSPKKAASGKPRSGGKSPALGSKIPKPAWSASPKASPRGDVHITAEGARRRQSSTGDDSSRIPLPREDGSNSPESVTSGFARGSNTGDKRPSANGSDRSAPLLKAISGSSDVLASGTAAKPMSPVLSAAEDSSHVDENTLATDDRESAPAACAESQGSAAAEEHEVPISNYATEESNGKVEAPSEGEEKRPLEPPPSPFASADLASATSGDIQVAAGDEEKRPGVGRRQASELPDAGYQQPEKKQPGCCGCSIM